MHMLMYVCNYVCMCMYIHTYIYIYIHIYIYIYIYVNKCFLSVLFMFYPPRAFRHMLRVPVGRELHPQLEFYEFPGGVGSSRWRWELQPLPLEFLKGGTEIPRVSRRGLLPPFRRPFSLSCLILALLGAILDHLGALRPYLVAKLLQDGAQMAQHSPT